jgi:hypothetical protein
MLDCGIHPGLTGMDALPFVDMIEADQVKKKVGIACSESFADSLIKKTLGGFTVSLRIDG